MPCLICCRLNWIQTFIPPSCQLNRRYPPFPLSWTFSSLCGRVRLAYISLAKRMESETNYNERKCDRTSLLILILLCCVRITVLPSLVACKQTFMVQPSRVHPLNSQPCSLLIFSTLLLLGSFPFFFNFHVYSNI